MKQLSVLELCAGAGGQALGFEQAGFSHAGLVELDAHACRTLRYNRPGWNVIQEDLHHFDARPFHGTDVIAAGLPCPPFSKAGKQLGENDERNLFPAALRVIREVEPFAVVIENVRGILDAVFSDYRRYVQDQLPQYWTDWNLLNACSFGVPQLRPRVNFVAIRKGWEHNFSWPRPSQELKAPTVGEALFRMMGANGWEGAEAWKEAANEIAPTLVGGSKKHGGPDLGPTRARRAWLQIGVDGSSLANTAPPPGFDGTPKLTVEMAACIQGFPSDWHFAGGKTAAYRQVGNAFPPPVAHAVASRVAEALSGSARLLSVA